MQHYTEIALHMHSEMLKALYAEWGGEYKMPPALLPSWMPAVQDATMDLLPCPSNLPKCFVAGKWYSQEQRTSRYREDIERNTCYRTTFLILWIADGKEVVKKFIDDSPQSTNTSAFFNTFCRCRTGLSTILPCRCHPRHSHPRHVGIRWCVDGLHGVTIY